MLRKVRTATAWTWATPKRRVVTVIAALAMMAAGVGVASWIITAGGGPVNGKIGTLQAPTFNSVSTYPAANPCFPGSSCDARVNVTNPNSTALAITSVSAASFAAAGGSITVTGASGTCTAANIGANISVPAQTFATPITVPVGTSDITIPGLLSASSALPTGCQGASFSNPGGTSYANSSPPTFTFSTP
jgi:hypothetical protein